VLESLLLIASVVCDDTLYLLNALKPKRVRKEGRIVEE
jgi:hypothetical protein